MSQGKQKWTDADDKKIFLALINQLGSIEYVKIASVLDGNRTPKAVKEHIFKLRQAAAAADNENNDDAGAGAGAGKASSAKNAKNAANTPKKGAKGKVFSDEENDDEEEVAAEDVKVKAKGKKAGGGKVGNGKKRALKSLGDGDEDEVEDTKEKRIKMEGFILDEEVGKNRE